MTAFTVPKLYSHWSQVPVEAFKARWPNFTPEELASKDRDPNKRGSVLIDPRALDMLQALRTRIGRPMVINSAYRSPEHNAWVKGAPGSAHLKGWAFDISMANHNPTDFEIAAVEVGFRGIGHYPNQNFMHVDARQSGTVVRWNSGGWFPQTAEQYHQPEKAPTKDGLKEAIIQTAPTVAPVLVGGAAVAQGDGPVQWAIALIAVMAFIGGIVWLVRRNRTKPVAESGEVSIP